MKKKLGETGASEQAERKRGSPRLVSLSLARSIADRVMLTRSTIERGTTSSFGAGLAPKSLLGVAYRATVALGLLLGMGFNVESNAWGTSCSNKSSLFPPRSF